MPKQQPQPATGQHPQPEQIAGLVERVTFHNDERKYVFNASPKNLNQKN